MSIRSLITIVCVLSIILSGCATYQDITHKRSVKNRAKAEFAACHGRNSQGKHYKLGWIDGFSDVAKGSQGKTRPFAPQKYYDHKFATHNGQGALAQWRCGYDAGVAHAISCGADSCLIIPSLYGASLPCDTEVIPEWHFAGGQGSVEIENEMIVPHETVEPIIAPNTAPVEGSIQTIEPEIEGAQSPNKVEEQNTTGEEDKIEDIRTIQQQFDFSQTEAQENTDFAAANKIQKRPVETTIKSQQPPVAEKPTMILLGYYLTTNRSIRNIHQFAAKVIHKPQSIQVLQPLPVEVPVVDKAELQFEAKKRNLIELVGFEQSLHVQRKAATKVGDLSIKTNQPTKAPETQSKSQPLRPIIVEDAAKSARNESKARTKPIIKVVR